MESPPLQGGHIYMQNAYMLLLNIIIWGKRKILTTVEIITQTSQNDYTPKYTVYFKSYLPKRNWMIFKVHVFVFKTP